MNETNLSFQRMSLLSVPGYIAEYIPVMSVMIVKCYMLLYLNENCGNIHHDAEWIILDDMETEIRCRGFKIVRN